MKKCDPKREEFGNANTTTRSPHARRKVLRLLSQSLSLLESEFVFASIDRGEILAILNLFLCVSLLCSKNVRKGKRCLSLSL